MALQSINIGTAANDGTGDNLRVGGDKINDNFSEIYTAFGNGSTLSSLAVTAMNGATVNEIVTVGSTTTELDAEANLTFDGSTLAVTGNITVPNDGDIGSVGATDAIQISSGGIVTFKDDIKIKDGGTIGTATDDDAITIADGGGITAANGITSTAASNTFGATSFNDANITNVGDIALDSLSADGSSISIASPVVINGSTPTLTIGDAGAEDTKLVFDGNAQDFYIGLDDSADDLLIGNGSTVGSNVAIGINESQVVQFNGAYTFPTSDGSANQVLQTNGSGALSFASVSGTTINNNADNRLITGSGTANTLEGEANATWNGNTLALTAGAGNTGISLTDGSTNYGFIGGGNALKSGGSANDFSFRTDTGSIDFYTNGQNLRFAIESDGVINTSELVRIGSGSTFENEACNIKKTGNNDDAVLALDSDTGDASFYRYIRFYKKNNNESLAKLDYDASGDTIGLAVESDERYKEITGPAVGLDLISKLEPIKYTREDTGVTDGCGFGAQSYKQAFDDIGEYPRGVTVGSDTVKWELDYSPLVPNLVKAIQEQQEQIKILQNKIQEIKGE